jgi:hypothetical protein
MGPGSTFLEPIWTRLKQIECLLKLDPALDPSLHLVSSSHVLSFVGFFFGGMNQLILPPKWCHVGLALICHFLVMVPHLKAHLSLYALYSSLYPKNMH